MKVLYATNGLGIVEKAATLIGRLGNRSSINVVVFWVRLDLKTSNSKLWGPVAHSAEPRAGRPFPGIAGGCNLGHGCGVTGYRSAN
jgi:hypothetical protein